VKGKVKTNKCRESECQQSSHEQLTFKDISPIGVSETRSTSDCCNTRPRPGGTGRRGCSAGIARPAPNRARLDTRADDLGQDLAESLPQHCSAGSRARWAHRQPLLTNRETDENATRAICRRKRERTSTENEPSTVNDTRQKYKCVAHKKKKRYFCCPFCSARARAHVVRPRASLVDRLAFGGLQLTDEGLTLARRSLTRLARRSARLFS
jgi:hypothetical protein